MKQKEKKYRATILFDMDEVLADMLNAWVDVYNLRYEDTLTRDDLTEWDTSLVVKKECGKKIYDLLRVPGLFRYLKPLPHTQEVIQRLVEANFDVVIVSDSPPGDDHAQYIDNPELVGNPADDKRAWLKEHFPMIPEKNVVFTGQKYRVMGDLLIDDKPETFELFEAKGRNILLMDMPYNRYINTPNRVRDLLEVEKIIYELFPE